MNFSRHDDAKPTTRVLIHGSLIHRHRGQARSHSWGELYLPPPSTRSIEELHTRIRLPPALFKP